MLRGQQGGGQGRRVRAPAAPRAELAERGAPPQAQDHDVSVFISRSSSHTVYFEETPVLPSLDATPGVCARSIPWTST